MINTPKTETAAPLTVSPERAAQMLDLGRTKVFALLATGELPHMKVGRRTLIPVPALHDFVSRHMAEQQREAA